MAHRWRLPTPPGAGFGGVRELTTTLSTPIPSRVVVRSRPPVPTGFTIVTAASWDELDTDRADLVRALLMLMPLALLVSASGAWWVAGRALRPAAAMAEEAQRLTEHSSGGRLTVGRADELGRLAAAFNGLVDRLESALAVRRQFLADASHELRTPVSVSRTAADVALSRPERTGDEYRDALKIVSEQMSHLGRIVSDMLTMARSDVADWPIAPVDFYFDELLAEAVRAMSVLSAARHVRIDTTCPPDLQVRGDEGLLRQMLVNLLENAVRHTPSGGTVHATVTASTSGLTVAIEDTGGGIAAADRERIFERFVHVPAPGQQANDEGGGTGLGLAIARRIARAHRGDLMLESTGPAGTRFAVTLPATGDSSSFHLASAKL
jgi:two-component system OmpR family sensor kinase